MGSATPASTRSAAVEKPRPSRAQATPWAPSQNPARRGGPASTSVRAGRVMGHEEIVDSSRLLAAFIRAQPSIP